MRGGTPPTDQMRPVGQDGVLDQVGRRTADIPHHRPDAALGFGACSDVPPDFVPKRAHAGFGLTDLREEALEEDARQTVLPEPGEVPADGLRVA